MPDQLQLRGGTTTEHNSFTGAAREVTVDTTKKTLVVHDGSQAGGTPLMKEAGANNAASVILGSGGVNAFTIDSNQDITLTGASANVVWDKSDNALEFADNAKAKFGTGSDLEIYHDGSESYITEGGTGGLFIQASAVILENTNGDNYFKGQSGGAAHLYHDGVIKLSTATTGITVADKAQIEGASGATELILKRTNTANSAGHSYGTLKFIDSSSNVIGKISTIRNTAIDDGDIRFEAKPTGGSLTEYLRIKSTGNIQIPVDNSKLQIGASQDLQIYHSGSHSFIDDTGAGDLYIRGDNSLKIQNAAGSEQKIVAITDGAVELYFDGSKKLETQADRINAYGHIFVLNGNLYLRNGFQNQNVRIRNTGGNNEANFEFLVSDGGTELEALEITKDGDLHIANDNKAIKIGASQDLQLFHDPNTNNIINNLGSLTIKKTDGDKYIHCSSNAQVELYHDGSKKAETYSNGLIAHHHLKVMGAQDQNAVIQMFADEGDNTNDQFLMASDAAVNRWVLQGQYVSGWHRYIQVNPQEGVQLYYDVLDSASPNPRLETISDGARATGVMRVRSEDLNVQQNTEPKYLVVATNSTVTITLTSLNGTGIFRAGGYANAGQGALGLHILFGGAMFATQHYNVNVLMNSAMQNTSISLTKNGTNYQIAITNSSSSSTLNLMIYLESTGAKMGYATA